MAHTHAENPKQVEALAELIRRHADQFGDPLTVEQATTAARVVTSMFDLAGKGTLGAFKKWVLMMHEAGEYADIGGPDNQAQNCAGEVCC